MKKVIIILFIIALAFAAPVMAKKKNFRNRGPIWKSFSWSPVPQPVEPGTYLTFTADNIAFTANLLTF